MEKDESLLAKLHSETAKMPWLELQTFFAKGSVLQVDVELDLIQVAAQFANDNTSQLKPLIDAGKIAAPDNDTARRWYNQSAIVWSVVVAPFVLVQEQVDQDYD